MGLVGHLVGLSHPHCHIPPQAWPVFNSVFEKKEVFVYLLKPCSIYRDFGYLQWILHRIR